MAETINKSQNTQDMEYSKLYADKFANTPEQLKKLEAYKIIKENKYVLNTYLEKVKLDKNFKYRKELFKSLVDNEEKYTWSIEQNTKLLYKLIEQRELDKKDIVLDTDAQKRILKNEVKDYIVKNNLALNDYLTKTGKETDFKSRKELYVSFFGEKPRYRWTWDQNWNLLLKLVEKDRFNKEEEKKEVKTEEKQEEVKEIKNEEKKVENKTETIPETKIEEKKEVINPVKTEKKEENEEIVVEAISWDKITKKWEKNFAEVVEDEKNEWSKKISEKDSKELEKIFKKEEVSENTEDNKILVKNIKDLLKEQKIKWSIKSVFKEYFNLETYKWTQEQNKKLFTELFKDKYSIRTLRDFIDISWIEYNEELIKTLWEKLWTNDELLLLNKLIYISIFDIEEKKEIISTPVKTEKKEENKTQVNDNNKSSFSNKELFKWTVKWWCVKNFRKIMTILWFPEDYVWKFKWHAVVLLSEKFKWQYKKVDEKDVKKYVYSLFNRPQSKSDNWFSFFLPTKNSHLIGWYIENWTIFVADPAFKWWVVPIDKYRWLKKYWYMYIMEETSKSKNPKLKRVWNLEEHDILASNK